MINHSFCSSNSTFFNSMLTLAEDIEEEENRIILIQIFFLTILPFQPSNKTNMKYTTC
jgi:hypothetical protein